MPAAKKPAAAKAAAKPKAAAAKPKAAAKAPAKKAQRTTHRSSTGTKLYAVRDAKGRFKDIQTYKRAHAADLRKKSKSETAAEAPPATDSNA